MKKKEKISDAFAIDFKKISDDDMISLRIQLDKECKKRKIKFNTSEIGEKVAIDFFNTTSGLDKLQRAPVGTKNVDALSRKGERYSIKTMKDGSKSSNFYLEGDTKSEKLFEYLLIVVLDEGYELKSLHRFSWDQFMKIKQWDSRMKAHYVSKSQTRLKQGECLFEKKD